jgi:hypothetical protein
MAVSKPDCAEIIKPIFNALKIIAPGRAIASPLSSVALIDP